MPSLCLPPQQQQPAFLRVETIFVLFQEQKVSLTGVKSPLACTELALELQELSQALLVVTVFCLKKTPILLALSKMLRTMVVVSVGRLMEC